MNTTEWIQEFPAAVTVTDERGTILAMNDRACAMFASDGGAALIGANVLTCHPEVARSKLAAMLNERTVNCYTIEKNGKWKMFYQAPWYAGGIYRGFVEIAMDIPADLPHFVRLG